MASPLQVPVRSAAPSTIGPAGRTRMVRAGVDAPARPAAELTVEALALEAQRARREAPGSTEAFEAIVLRLQGPLYHFLCIRTGSNAEAEELVQEAFLRAWQKLDRYDSRWRFSTWLFTLAKRLAASRARTRRPVLSADVFADRVDELDPARSAEAREEHSNVWRLAGRVLSAEQRSALWLRYAEDLSIEEVARILGKRRVTARVLLFRARETLAKHMTDGGRR